MNGLKNVTWMAIVPACLLICASAAGAADLPKESCANIKWNPAFLKDYPNAPVTCQAVTVRDGVKYAKFYGKVSKVDHQSVQVAISDVGNFPVSTIEFEVGQGGRITLGEKSEMVKDLHVGDLLTFWVREGEFGVSPTLADRPIPIVKPEAMPAS
jgi:hypothetical protein